MTQRRPDRLIETFPTACDSILYERNTERFTTRVLPSIYFQNICDMCRIYVRDFRIILRGRSNSTADK